MKHIEIKKNPKENYNRKLFFKTVPNFMLKDTHIGRTACTIPCTFNLAKTACNCADMGVV